jgi:hypothetical protein
MVKIHWAFAPSHAGVITLQQRLVKLVVMLHYIKSLLPFNLLSLKKTPMQELKQKCVVLT